jgi:2-polyprenyl-6-methoxyphenol hydroxylase-like FAD-dependent oxidoreductase
LGEGCVRFGRELSSLDSGGDTARLGFADGSTAEADQVIGADGIGSVVRTTLFGDVPLRYSGQTCFRGLVLHSTPGSSDHAAVRAP